MILLSLNLTNAAGTAVEAMATRIRESETDWEVTFEDGRKPEVLTLDNMPAHWRKQIAQAEANSRGDYRAPKANPAP